MGVPISDVGYTSATTGRGDHEVHKGHVVALGAKKIQLITRQFIYGNRGQIHTQDKIEILRK
jgi:hypothetical protein